MNITDEELQEIETIQTAEAWVAFCDKFKAARGGAYPPDWWQKVKLSGLMDRTFARFGATTEIKVSNL